jgi:hypothetical protein
MKLGIESRPRIKSYQLKVSVQSISVEDKWTEGSIFPHIITPPAQRDLPQSAPSLFLSKIGSPTSTTTSPVETPAKQLFELLYEVRPEGSGEKMFK